MAIGKGEKKTRWEDVVAGFKVQQSKKASGKASGSAVGPNPLSKDNDAGKNGGGTEGAPASETTKE